MNLGDKEMAICKIADLEGTNRLSALRVSSKEADFVQHLSKNTQGN